MRAPFAYPLGIGTETGSYVLRPILVGKQARMHTVVALLATIGGMMAFGAIGVFVGPVIAALFIAMLELYHKELMPPPASSEPAKATRDTAS